ncbi:hypothetical protein Cch01nite_17740 [Cellulomonas chitinilytica]|uniref:DUF4190 domain-containing protein n=1 Tax=Cellulomonas chitinilytica TaxID=398759 RepID=A0A919TYW5_9CELL|nr:DUF4190 domain-containing protein [Cellulomonas chitinilytica]GIG21050.1 hypothetical protein Cch01nite_17740 [Cellulomonas chitinilytica]
MSTPQDPQNPTGGGTPQDPASPYGAPTPPPDPSASQYPPAPQYPTYGQGPEASQYPPAPQYPAGQYPQAGQYPPAGQYPAATPYGAGQYGYVYPKNSLGVWALVLGIASIALGCGFFAGIPAIIVGNNAKRAVAEGQANNGGLGSAGVILGWIGVGLSVLGIVAWAIIIGVAGIDAGTSGY